MAGKSLTVAKYFNEILDKGNYNLVLIRGDRFEMLPIAMLAAYKGIPIAHIEGGDVSGAIDNKVRHSITHLSDLHFPTNDEAMDRLVRIGKDNVFNYGSLDVEYAKNFESEITDSTKPYAVMCYHPMENEDPYLIQRIVALNFPGELIVIKSNSDNGNSHGKSQFTPEEYIRLIKGAKFLIGNSSSFIKEASVFGTPVVLVGDRQRGRLLTRNVTRVGYNSAMIVNAINEQLKSQFAPDNTYYQPFTSEMIAYQIKKFLNK